MLDELERLLSEAPGLRAELVGGMIEFTTLAGEDDAAARTAVAVVNAAPALLRAIREAEEGERRILKAANLELSNDAFNAAVAQAAMAFAINFRSALWAFEARSHDPR